MSPLSLVLSALLLAAEPAAASKYFEIAVVDEQTGRGVPLVELRTVNHLHLVTDSNGLVAFHEPGLMGQTVFFHVSSHGYEHAKDGFGYRGKALAVTEGGRAQLTVKRLNIAERLYRVTGGGIYADSTLLDKAVPLKRPVLDGLVFGSDSVVNTLYGGKLHWFWGDTNRPAYPLGNFHVPGATSLLPAKGGLDPSKGVDLDYFLDAKGFAKPTCQMPGQGPTWITALTVVPDRTGRERMLAGYVKVRGQLEIYERGLAEWDDARAQFVQVKTFPPDAPIHLGGHPFRHTVGGVEYVYLAAPFPLVRVRADAESMRDPTQYEAYTCLKPGTKVSQGEVEQYGWKKNTPPVGPGEQATLIRQGKLKPESALLHLQEATTGKVVRAHGGSVNWNAHRGRWVLIAVEHFGTSLLGEVWYAEADTPLGPWVYARKVVTHERYSFYNPRQHPYFDQDGGRLIYFEGTYTTTFSGNPLPTPRYDYNQVMYRLDLADPRLALPVAVWERVGQPGAGLVTARGRKGDVEWRAAFFAPDRPAPGTVPVYPVEGTNGWQLEVSRGSAKGEPLFHALPPDTPMPPTTVAPLYEYIQEDGPRRLYSLDNQVRRPGYSRSPRPVCLVWRNPLQGTLPAE